MSLTQNSLYAGVPCFGVAHSATLHLLPYKVAVRALGIDESELRSSDKQNHIVNTDEERRPRIRSKC